MILKSFLDKGWDSCMGIVSVSEIKMIGVRDYGVEGALCYDLFPTPVEHTFFIL